MADPATGQILRLPGARLSPPIDAERRGLFDRCAVYSAAGEEIALAQTEGRAGVFTTPPEGGPPDTGGHLPGTWLFGGVAYGHFGHALAFSTARLWGLDHLTSPIDGILFFARGQTDQLQPVGGYLADLLSLFGINVPARMVSAPLTVETLLVPSQGWGTNALITGTPEHRDFVRRRLVSGARPQGPGRLYISRARLPERHARGLMFQGLINRFLTDEGYTIFHPQEHSLADQIAAYRAADRVIAEDGSALHVAAMAADPSARFAILATRGFFPMALAGQVQAFSGARAQVFNFVRAAVARRSDAQTGMGWNRARIALDFEKLGAALAKTGFVNRPDLWKNPPDTKLDRRIASYQTRMKQPIVDLPLADLKISGQDT